MSTATFPADSESVRLLLRASLAEDIGTGDITSRCTVSPDVRARGRVVAREPLVVAGVSAFAPLVEELTGLGKAVDLPESLHLLEAVADGTRVAGGASVCVMEGAARAVLTFERTFLNFLGHLSGVATETSAFVEAVRSVGASTRILDTRKTTPGWRLLEKYAVVCGGGANHRMGLADGIRIRDNTGIAAGGVLAAVRAASAAAPAGTEPECECDTTEQAEEALAAGATALLLDNFTPAAVADAVCRFGERARLEVSGGITLATVAEYAAAGPHDISVGRLTHSARSVDLSMEVELLS